LADQPIQYAESADGTRVAYRRFGSGRHVVFVGGALSTAEAARPLAAAFAEEGLQGVTYDRRGRGSSGDTAPYAPEREAEDLGAVIDAVGGAAVVLGHSSGAVLSLYAAAEGVPMTHLFLSEPPLRFGQNEPPADLADRLQVLVDQGRNDEAVLLFLREDDIVAAMILGVYFAFSSGTVDSVVYDTVVEHTGSNELYETWIGRTRAVESAAFVLSALAGGVLAQYTSTRVTYFATVPLVGLAVIGFLRFEEPRLHQAAEGVSLRHHVALTFRTMITSRAVLCVLLLVAAGGLLSQAVFEFGPLWLVEVAAPAVVYGPYWAVLVSTLGVAGLLIGKLDLDRRLLLAALIILSLATALLLAWTRSLPLLMSAQVVLALVLAIISIHASRLLHDAVPSSVRAGVSSGGGTLTWMLFLPFSLLFGWVAVENGINWSGFMLAGAAVVLAVLLVISVRASRGVTPVQVAATAKQEAVEVTEAAEQLACKQLVELVADYLDDALSPEIRARFEEHLTGCDGCTTYLKQTQQIISELRGLSTKRNNVQAPRRQSTDH
jgi:hypothetical protein